MTLLHSPFSISKTRPDQFGQPSRPHRPRSGHVTDSLEEQTVQTATACQTSQQTLHEARLPPPIVLVVTVWLLLVITTGRRGSVSGLAVRARLAVRPRLAVGTLLLIVSHRRCLLVVAALRRRALLVWFELLVRIAIVCLRRLLERKVRWLILGRRCLVWWRRRLAGLAGVVGLGRVHFDGFSFFAWRSTLV